MAEGFDHSLADTRSLRPLGGIEHYLWKAAQAGSRNFSIVASFSGTQGSSARQTAFRRVQTKHPLSNMTLGEDAQNPQAPVFIKGAGEPVPLRIEKRSSPTAWQDEAPRELIKPFDAKVAPLVRAVLLEDEAGCDMILIAHHSIGDSLSLLALVGDLLAALAGERFAPLPLPVSLEERFAQLPKPSKAPEPLADSEKVAAESGTKPARMFRYRGVAEPPRMDALRLPEALTAQIMKTARMHEVTLGAMLLTALSVAARRLSPALGKEDVQILFPVDVRNLVGNQGELSYAVGVGRASVRYPEASFWETAGLLREQIRAAQTASALDAFLAQVNGLMAMNLDATVLVSAWAQAGFDLYLSNLRTAEFPKAPKDLRVEALWGTGLILGLEGEQNIGAVTFGGALHLLNTSYTPLEGLFAMAQQILEETCAPTQ